MGIFFFLFWGIFVSASTIRAMPIAPTHIYIRNAWRFFFQASQKELKTDMDRATPV
jgi:hypothetical protein